MAAFTDLEYALCDCDFLRGRDTLCVWLKDLQKHFTHFYVCINRSGICIMWLRFVKRLWYLVCWRLLKYLQKQFIHFYACIHRSGICTMWQRFVKRSWYLVCLVKRFVETFYMPALIDLDYALCDCDTFLLPAFIDLAYALCDCDLLRGHDILCVCVC